MSDPFNPAAFRLPSIPMPAIQQSAAEWMYERLCKQITKFESKLSENEEIGGRIVAAPGGDTFHIEDIGYWGPDLVIFYGNSRDGRPLELLQHVTQISVLLTALPKEQEAPRRIGFMLMQRFNK